MSEPMDCRPDEKELFEKKVKIWRRFLLKNHPGESYKYLAFCYSCLCVLSMPEAVKKNLKLDIDNTKHPNAQYGHLISDSNGGEASLNNLVLQCQKCNTELGKKNMHDGYYELIDGSYRDFCEFKIDQQAYIAKEYLNQLHNNKCTHLIKSNSDLFKYRFCKKRSLNNCEFCSCHKGKVERHTNLDYFKSLPYFNELLE
jgi:hypothetical protein